jgi:hypothetical protein
VVCTGLRRKKTKTEVVKKTKAMDEPRRLAWVRMLIDAYVAAYVAAAVGCRRDKMDRIARRVDAMPRYHRESILLQMKDTAIEMMIIAHRRSNALLEVMFEDKTYVGARACHIRANQLNHNRRDVMVARLSLVLNRLDRVRLNSVEERDSVAALINGHSTDLDLVLALLAHGLQPFPMAMQNVAGA